MADRILILFATAVLILLGWVVLRLWKRALLRRLRMASPMRDMVAPGHPGVIAFTAPHCQECHTKQAPALKRLQATLGDQVTVNTVSALDYPELVQKLGILTVPATAVVDATGTVRHLNLGYASDLKLREQLNGFTKVFSQAQTGRQTLPAR